MPYLSRDGCDLYYETHGDGPALVFVHGAGGNHLSWWQQIPHFRDRYTCVTYAQRGFGLSRDAAGGPGPAAFAEDLAALIDDLGYADVRLVAQSMGGWASLTYTVRHPERVKALVMADTSGSFTSPECDRLIQEHRATHSREALFARGIHPACGERLAQEQPALHFLYAQVSDLTTVPAGLDLTAKLAELRTTTVEQVGTLRMPVLCLAGEEDVVLPPAAVELLASKIPGARYVSVPKAGHSVYWQYPETFNQLVDALLADVDRR